MYCGVLPDLRGGNLVKEIYNLSSCDGIPEVSWYTDDCYDSSEKETQVRHIWDNSNCDDPDVTIIVSNCTHAESASTLEYILLFKKKFKNRNETG